MKNKICKVDGCNNRNYVKGFCNKHYTRNLKYGNPHTVKVNRENHGMSSTPEYKVWEAMIARCSNPNIYYYHRYGGRGITVCNEWKTSFLAFITDMGRRPYPKAQIDRINNDGDYEPSNCEWVSSTYNKRHSSKAKLSMDKARSIRNLYKVSNLSCRQIGEEYGVSKRAIGNVINNERWKEGIE